MHAATVDQHFDAIVSGLYRAATGAISWSEALARLGDVIGRWWRCNDVFDEDFARRNTFCRHVLPAHDTRHLAMAMIDSSPTTVSAYALEQPAVRGAWACMPLMRCARTGERLGVALTTIRTHLRSVRRRLGAARTVDAVRLLREGQALWAHSGA
jgi:hypothetical protein